MYDEPKPVSSPPRGGRRGNDVQAVESDSQPAERCGAIVPRDGKEGSARPASVPIGRIADGRAERDLTRTSASGGHEGDEAGKAGASDSARDSHRARDPVGWQR